MTFNRQQSRSVSLLCLLAIATLLSGLTQAQKTCGGAAPVGPVPTGTIYFTNSGLPWSMKGDGSRIAYNRIPFSWYQEIIDVWTINADGTNSVQLTQYIGGKQYNGTSQHLPIWSPQGNYLVDSERVINGNKTTFNVSRIPSAGGAKTNLTSDGKSSYPRWRQ